MGFEEIRDYATKISLYLSFFYRLDNIKKQLYSKRFYIFTLDKIPWRRYKRIEFFIKFPKIHDAMLILAEYFRRAFALCTCNIS